jgi:methyltransferase (TIGR00027 family)
MLENTPSRTSQVVALIRAGLERDHSPDGNPDAQTELCKGMRPVSADWFVSDMVARTRFVDDQVTAGIEDGITQIVVLGAGYDDRALRFTTPGVRFFEVDHPGTQQDKRERLERLGAASYQGGGPVLVSADFASDDLFAVLGDHGHDHERPSVFVCEGLLVYLEQNVILEMLSAARRRSPERSRLVASLAVHAEGLSSRRVLAAANRRRANADAEPWKTILPAGQHLDLLRSAGWSVEMSVDAADIESSLDRGRSLLVRAVPSEVDRS